MSDIIYILDVEWDVQVLDIKKINRDYEIHYPMIKSIHYFPFLKYMDVMVYGK